MSFGLLFLAVVGGLFLLLLALLAAAIAALVALSRRQRVSQEQHRARISRELERIKAMEAAGRISAAESAELVAALEGSDRTPAGAPFSGRLCKSSAPLLAGVCGGLAEWLGWDPTLVRAGYALATILIACFPGIILYIILALVMPPHPNAPPVRAGRVLTGVLLLVLAPLALLVGVGSCSFTRHRTGEVHVDGTPVVQPAIPLQRGQ